MADRLRDDQGIHRGVTDKCVICGGIINLKLCAKCKHVAYCCKDHQKQDWPSHKNSCKKISRMTAVAKTDENQTVVPSVGVVRKKLSRLSIENNGLGERGTYDDVRVMNQTVSVEQSLCENLFTNSTCEESSIENDSIKTETSSESLQTSVHTLQNQSEKNILELPEQTDQQRKLSDSTVQTESGSSEKFILESEDSRIQAPDYSGQSENTESPLLSDPKMPYFSVVESRNKALGEYVTKCLNSYGLCVIDNFLGDAKGTDILDEVADMHEHGELTSGQLVNTASPKGEVRGDIITWVDGSELGCSNINCLITSIDAIMLHCQRSLGQYHVKGRSKAMVAAYPGNATHFLRHVDNPSGDGRCVTCIYYLNKNWNSKVDGGLLRIFPEGSSKVANIEPKFDRLLFFWSDRRNPHEVLPAYKTRYAVTVWYYDEQERKRAVKKFKGRSGMEAKHKQVYSLPSRENVDT